MYINNEKSINRKSLFLLAVLILIIWLMSLLREKQIESLIDSFFLPLQQFRSSIFNVTDVSIGDLCYILLLGILIYKGVQFFVRKKFSTFNTYINASIIILIAYIVLLVIWGINYKRKPLLNQLSIESISSNQISKEEWIAFDSIIITRLNERFYKINEKDSADINRTATFLYSNLHQIQLKAKVSLFGSAIGYLGIEGYYNPFTGEAQINPSIPYFTMPFIICHEMAHQLGIANEAEANLKAYIMCETSKNDLFMYSGTFNLFKYIHRKVVSLDSNVAKRLKAQLDPNVLAHYEILKNRRKKYSGSAVDKYSDFIFDSYLKLENQKDGIASYRNVAAMAFQWEKATQRL
jgi:hypothetical protein